MPDPASVLTADDPAFPSWLAERAPELRLLGAASLLAEPPVALIGSRQCPGTVLLAAARRNDLLGRLMRAAVVLHAAPGSRTLAWAERVAARGISLYTIDHASNAPLLDLGAAPLQALFNV